MTLVAKKVALSISDAPDRGRLGFPPHEVDRALFSICSALIRAGAELYYAGNLAPSGYTFKIFEYLAGAYAGQGQVPFVHVIPEPILRTTSFTDLADGIHEARKIAATAICLAGDLIPARTTAGGLLIGAGSGPRRLMENPDDYQQFLNSFPIRDDQAAYTAARKAVSQVADARVSLGGKMGILGNPADSYLGSTPGIIEEAILTLELAKPYIALGAFGGATRDVAIALDLIDPLNRVPRAAQDVSYVEALKEVTLLRGRIPDFMRDRLRAVALDDRAEVLGQQVTYILSDWLDATSGAA